MAGMVGVQLGTLAWDWCQPGTGQMLSTPRSQVGRYLVRFGWAAGWQVSLWKRQRQLPSSRDWEGEGSSHPGLKFFSFRSTRQT